MRVCLVYLSCLRFARSARNVNKKHKKLLAGKRRSRRPRRGPRGFITIGLNPAPEGQVIDLFRVGIVRVLDIGLSVNLGRNALINAEVAVTVRRVGNGDVGLLSW